VVKEGYHPVDPGALIWQRPAVEVPRVVVTVLVTIEDSTWIPDNYRPVVIQAEEWFRFSPSLFPWSWSASLFEP